MAFGGGAKQGASDRAVASHDAFVSRSDTVILNEQWELSHAKIDSFRFRDRTLG